MSDGSNSLRSMRTNIRESAKAKNLVFNHPWMYNCNNKTFPIAGASALSVNDSTCNLKREIQRFNLGSYVHDINAG